MHPEAISQPIKAQSIEEHERMLNDKMTKIKLEYVDRILLKKIPLLTKNQDEEEDVSIDDFASLLNRYTPVLRELMECYIIQKKQEGIEWDEEMYDPAESEFFNKIFEFREADHDHWIEKTMQLLGEERAKVKAVSRKRSFFSKDKSRKEEERYQVGIVDFHIENVGLDNRDWLKPLDAIIKRGDACISIHLEPLYKKTLHDNGVNIFSSKPLERLAVRIITEYPETKAVIANSWVMDGPIGRRMGFKVYDRKEYIDSPAFWGQFMNSDGQINNDRVKKFLETGQAPYGVVTGAMEIEDFLRKYLPKEYRGKITLKEQNPDFNIEELEHDVRILRDLLDKNWDTIDEVGLLDVFSQCPLMQRFNESTLGNGFFDFLINLKRRNRKLEDFLRTNRFTSYDLSLVRFLSAFRFKDREVIIE